MEKEKISVVVPCYNVEKYVEKGIKSLLEQTYENLEIIAIDDCSTDNTYSILEKLAKENREKIKLYKNEENKGLARTRNRGISICETNYIGFMDPDDYLDSTYYEELYKAIKENEADIAITDVLLVNEQGEELQPVQPGINTDVKDMKMAAIDNGLCASACNKLFKKANIEQYLFLEGKVNEDIASVIPTVLHAKKLAYTNKVKYYYVQRAKSIQNSEFSERRFDIIDSVQETLKRIKDLEKYEEYKNIIFYHQILMLYVYVITALPTFKQRQKFIKMFIEREKEVRVENNGCVPKYLNTRNRFGKMYWYVVIKLLKLKSATLINLVITLGHALVKIKQKLIDKKDKEIVTKKLTIEDLIKQAKIQNKMKSSNIKVSATVPNYNYEDFLIDRLYSILYQTEKVEEIIILDDCSKDNSRELIDKIVEELKPYVNIKKVYNEQNTGVAFKQWQKGFNLATGDYVWIAEADDYCDKNMLKELLKPIRKNKNITISYVDTAFVNKEGKIFLKSIKPEIDIRKTGHWDKSFVNNGEKELNEYTFLNCTVANVSSAIIKKGNYDKFFEDAVQYRQAGDWVFYSNVMKLGDIAYSNKTYNYYRVHGNNITSTMKKQKHLEEIKRIHAGMAKITNLTDWHYEEFNKRYEFLTKVWNLNENQEEIGGQDAN